MRAPHVRWQFLLCAFWVLAPFTSCKQSIEYRIIEVEKSAAWQPGDLILKDGSRIAADTITPTTLAAATAEPIAVVGFIQNGRPVGIGIKVSTASGTTAAWATSGTLAYAADIPAQRGTMAHRNTGKENFSYLVDYYKSNGSAAPKDDALTHCPVFRYAETYGTTSGVFPSLEGTPYETGWFIPSLNELYEIYQFRDRIRRTFYILHDCNTDPSTHISTLPSHSYWSSSQSSDMATQAYQISFYESYTQEIVLSLDKSQTRDIIVVHTF
ncbi:MAG: hypothetical protein IJ191_06075 [Treponema sp.]|nr:hypothetical protein [Treponema sp.]